MPKTKKQGILFGLITAFIMVFVMATYMVAMQLGGFRLSLIAATLKDMWIEYVVAFFLAGNVVHPWAVRRAPELAPELAPAKENGGLFNHVVGAALTVAIMVPCMTLLASVLHGGLNATLIDRWVNSIVMAFPMALATNLLIAGPLSGRLFNGLMLAYAKIHLER